MRLQDRLCCAHLGGAPCPPVGPRIPAGPAEGRHLRRSTGRPGGPPALTCCRGPLCGHLAAEGSGCALSRLALGVLTEWGCPRPSPPESLRLPQYFGLLLIIFLLEIIAGALAYIYYQQVRAGTGRVRAWTCT